MTFDVKGMTCAACSAHVEKSVRKLEGVKDVNVSLLTNSMEVDFDPQAVSAEQICRAVASGGYSASARGAAEAEKAARPDAGAELKAMRNRLIASFALLIVLMYVAMGHMLGLPMPPALHRPMVSGLIQLLIVIPAITSVRTSVPCSFNLKNRSILRTSCSLKNKYCHANLTLPEDRLAKTSPTFLLVIS